jgi:hypothetical protein
VQVSGRLVIAVDGKAVRGAKVKDGKAPHLVAALAHGLGTVLGQVAVTARSNEVPAVRELLKALTNLAGAVITIGALHTQHDTAQVNTSRGADYVMTVKGNMPALQRQLRKLPRARIPAVSSVSKGRGRRSRRTIKVALAPAWIEFRGAAQAAQLRRTVTKKGKKTVEVVYLITSDRMAGPAAERSRTSCTGSATSPTRKTSPWSGRGTRPGSWRRCAASRSASCAWTATTTSPPPTATTPATRSGHSSYCRPHDRLCRVPGPIPGTGRAYYEGSADRYVASVQRIGNPDYWLSQLAKIDS